MPICILFSLCGTNSQKPHFALPRTKDFATTCFQESLFLRVCMFRLACALIRAAVVLLRRIRLRIVSAGSFEAEEGCETSMSVWSVTLRYLSASTTMDPQLRFNSVPLINTALLRKDFTSPRQTAGLSCDALRNQSSREPPLCQTCPQPRAGAHSKTVSQARNMHISKLGLPV